MSAYHKNPEFAVELPDCGGWFPRLPDEWFLIAAALIPVLLIIWLLFFAAK